MPLSDQLIDQLLADCKSPEDQFCGQVMLRLFNKRFAEHALEAEMEQILDYFKNWKTSS